MKFILAMLITINSASAFEMINGGSYVPFRDGNDDIMLGLLQILTNHGSISSRVATKIARSAVKASKEHEVPVNVVLAIAFVESSYQLNAVNKGSNDYGIMQINQWHINKSKLDKEKLLTDLDYSFHHGVRIFKWFYHKYPLDEAVRRYNCGTAKNCIKWKSVVRYLDKVKKAM